MVSGIRFFACSGAMGMFGNKGEKSLTQVYTETGKADPLLEIFNLNPGDTNNPNRMGFFGTNGAPNSAVIVGQYQDTTFRTNHNGSQLGEMINVKFTGANTATVSGTLGSGPMFGANFNIANLTNISGTLLARFHEPNDTAVITQQATFRAVNFTTASGVPDISDLVTGITMQAAQLRDTAGNAANASWTQISSGGAALSLSDQALESNIHDFHLIVSGSPTGAGRKTNFGYLVRLEFL